MVTNSVWLDMTFLTGNTVFCTWETGFQCQNDPKVQRAELKSIENDIFATEEDNEDILGQKTRFYGLAVRCFED